MWLWRPIPTRLWVRNGGSKHGSLQQRPNMRCLSSSPTNFCPPNYTPPVDIHWCNPPNKHFDLSMKMFTSIAEYRSGIVPVKFRRVKCQKSGGVRFDIKGNPNFIMVLVYNVGGAGDVNSVAIKGHKSSWISMQRNWVIPDPILKRDDTNILYTCKISYVDAILGTTLKVPTVDGTVDLKVSAGTQPSTTLVMAKKGVPVLNKSKMRGNKAMQSQQYLEAIELYSFAIALLDKNAVFYCNRAAAYTQISMCSEAIKAYSRLGLAYYAQGEYADAIEKGFKKALELDPHNESVKENIRVAEQKLREEEQRQRRNQNTNMGHNQDPGMGGQGIPSQFSMPLNPDMMRMFMNMTGNRGGDGNINGTNEHEIRVGGNINIDLGAADQMPEEFSGALRSMMQMFGGSQEGNNNNPQGTNGRPSGS
ncbi:unnamed protein product [Eruca vesicaria subsp. sativa]|uniref:Uncharacterized protein n=1 Tax=Eruca vesicaria subsp. sativa TaxID=29727 RepID=A0ABC8K5M3_ERUVS|nr:unnamed protein product [Eruca vesicaria subsp. sativa]